MYQEAQQDNFVRLKQNPNATYVEVDKNFAENILKLVNEERTKRGLRVLRLAYDLQEGAAIRAKELTILYDHTRPNGEPCYTVIIASEKILRLVSVVWKRLCSHG